MLKTLSPNTLILTATKRLAVEYGQHLPQHAHAIPFNQWVTHLWNTPHATPSPHPTLLTPEQSLTLWYQIISTHTQTFIMRPFATAQLAQHAYYLLKHWEISLESITTHHHPDVRTFARWATQYESSLRERGMIDENELYRALPKKGMPKKIILAGFDALTPAQKHFIDKINVDVTFSEPLAKNTHCKVVQCETRDTEIQTAARYFKTQLQKNPDHTFALIVPNLTPIKRKITAIFLDVFSETLQKNPTDTPSKFNIASAEALYHFPMIITAFRLLQCHTPWPDIKHDIKHVSHLLNSPFLLGAETEMITRAELDAIVRLNAEPQISLRQTLRFARQKNTAHYCPQWATLIENTLVSLKTWPQKTTPSIWSQHFSTHLDALGWPGERALNNEETQLQTALSDLFVTFKQLDSTLSTLSAHDALQHLIRLAQNTLFHVKTQKAVA